MKCLTVPLSSWLVLGGLVAAQPLPEIHTTIHRTDASHWQLSWPGAAGYTFFPMHSPSRDLMGFAFLPIPGYIDGPGLLTFVIESGPGLYPKGFYRLKYTDLDPENLAGDGVPALFKINMLGIDPFASSGTGTNGLNDAWEAYFFGVGNIDQVSPAAVLQPDGLTNKEKADLGLDPNVNYNTSTQRAQFQYDLTGRLIGVAAPLIEATYIPDEEGNLKAQ